MFSNKSVNSPKKDIVLWGVKISPYVRKVMVILEEKGLPYRLVETLPAKFLKATNQPVPTELMKLSPLGKIPAIQDDEVELADSAAIAAYLDKKYPETRALYPEEPALYAKALWFESFADHTLSKITYDKVLFPAVAKPLVLKIECDHQEVKKAIEEELTSLLYFLEEILGDNQWIVGNTFTVADIAIASQFSGMDLAGYPLDENQWPILSAYLKRVMSLKSYQKALSSN